MTDLDRLKIEMRARWEYARPILMYFAEPFEWWHVPYLIVGLLGTLLTLVEMLSWF